MKKHLVIGLLLFAGLAGRLSAEEVISSTTTPYVQDPRSATSLRISMFQWMEPDLARPELDQLIVELSNGPVVQVVRYSGQAAHDLGVQLNHSNNSVTSMKTRILNKALSDGKVTGTVSGSAE